MSKLRIVSDLHIEFNENEYHLSEMDGDNETILVLAGDICVGVKLKKYLYFFEDVNKRFLKVIYILGNHEYYKSNLPTLLGKLESGLEHLKNIIILNNSHYDIDGIRFIGGTLWTDFDKGNPMATFDAQRYMYDYVCIRTGSVSEPWKRKFRPADSISEHFKTKNYIFKNLSDSLKNVVVSHHAPSKLSVDDRYVDDSLNSAYHSNLEYDILDSEISLWIHGHMHSSKDYMIGDTRVVLNPRGYSGVELNSNFDDKMVIDV